MKTINNFFIDKEKKSHQNCLLLKDFIEEFVNENYIYLNLLELSEILNIPVNILKDKSKQLILNKFNFKKGKFNFNDSIFKIFSDYLIFIFLTF